MFFPLVELADKGGQDVAGRLKLFRSLYRLVGMMLTKSVAYYCCTPGVG
jgi:hypothetical protein